MTTAKIWRAVLFAAAAVTVPAFAEGFLPAGILNGGNRYNRVSGFSSAPGKTPHPGPAGKTAGFRKKQNRKIRPAGTAGDPEQNDVDRIVNSRFGKRLYGLEVEIAVQEKKNELLKLKEQALQMTAAMEKIMNPAPALPRNACQYPEKGYFGSGETPGLQSLLKGAQTAGFSVAMTEKNIKALIRAGNDFFFVRPGEKLAGGRVTKISQNGITLKQNGRETFFPVSVRFPETTRGNSK